MLPTLVSTFTGLTLFSPGTYACEGGICRDDDRASDVFAGVGYPARIWTTRRRVELTPWIVSNLVLDGSSTVSLLCRLLASARAGLTWTDGICQSDLSPHRGLGG